MKKQKDVKQKEVKKKMETKKRFGISDAFYEAGRIGAGNKTELLGNIASLLKTKNVTKTKNGTLIDGKVIARQVSAMCFDITKQRGRWKGTKLLTENEFKIVSSS